MRVQWLALAIVGALWHSSTSRTPVSRLAVLASSRGGLSPFPQSCTARRACCSPEDRSLRLMWLLLPRQVQALAPPESRSGTTAGEVLG